MKSSFHFHSKLQSRELTPQYIHHSVSNVPLFPLLSNIPVSQPSYSKTIIQHYGRMVIMVAQMQKNINDNANTLQISVKKAR